MTGLNAHHSEDVLISRENVQGKFPEIVYCKQLDINFLMITAILVIFFQCTYTYIYVKIEVTL